MQGLLDIGADFKLHYTIDDFTDPWRKPETIVLVHGLAESGDAWYAWVPHLAREYRVVRFDQRGFGRSTPMAVDFPWTLDELADDLARLINAAGHGPAHVIGAKIGATVSTHFRHYTAPIALYLDHFEIAFRRRTIRAGPGVGLVRRAPPR